MPGKVGAAMIVGGGISGMQAALDLADSGIKVYLVDNKSSIGGVMVQLDKTFPTMDCAMCTIAPRLVTIGRHPNIEKLSYSEVVDVHGEAGRFSVKIRKKARSVDPDKCTGCGECVQNCLTRYKVYPPQEVVAPKLSDEERIKTEEILNRYKEKVAPLISVLQDIQEEFNYLPAPILYYVSKELNIPLAHILKVATFYTLFSLKPKGKYVISVCQGTACFVRGSERIMEELEKTLGIKEGEVTRDGKFSLETVRCLGCCALAPVTRIGRDVHGRLLPINVRDILKRY